MKECREDEEVYELLGYKRVESIFKSRRIVLFSASDGIVDICRWSMTACIGRVLSSTCTCMYRAGIAVLWGKVCMLCSRLLCAVSSLVMLTVPMVRYSRL